MEEKEKEDIVYGSHCGEVTFFFPISVAQHYANLHSAHDKGISFAELFDNLPDFFFLIIGYRYYLFYGKDFFTSMEGLTCEEFYSKLLKELYRDVDHKYDSLDDFCNFYKRLPVEDRIPLKDEIFNEKIVPSESLIEIINYGPDINWAPADILKKFAHTELTLPHGYITFFNEEDEEGIVKEFELSGYRCIHNVNLIAQAHGTELPG